MFNIFIMLCFRWAVVVQMSMGAILSLQCPFATLELEDRRTHWRTSQQGLDSLYCERARWETSQRDNASVCACLVRVSEWTTVLRTWLKAPFIRVEVITAVFENNDLSMLMTTTSPNTHTRSFETLPSQVANTFHSTFVHVCERVFYQYFKLVCVLLSSFMC